MNNAFPSGPYRSNRQVVSQPKSKLIAESDRSPVKAIIAVHCSFRNIAEAIILSTVGVNGSKSERPATVEVSDTSGGRNMGETLVFSTSGNHHFASRGTAKISSAGIILVLFAANLTALRELCSALHA